jgi:hypothetical protein
MFFSAINIAQDTNRIEIIGGACGVPLVSIQFFEIPGVNDCEFVLREFYFSKGGFEIFFPVKQHKPDAWAQEKSWNRDFEIRFGHVR